MVVFFVAIWEQQHENSNIRQYILNSNKTTLRNYTAVTNKTRDHQVYSPDFRPVHFFSNISEISANLYFCGNVTLKSANFVFDMYCKLYPCKFVCVLLYPESVQTIFQIGMLWWLHNFENACRFWDSWHLLLVPTPFLTKSIYASRWDGKNYTLFYKIILGKWQTHKC